MHNRAIIGFAMFCLITGCSREEPAKESLGTNPIPRVIPAPNYNVLREIAYAATTNEITRVKREELTSPYTYSYSYKNGNLYSYDIHTGSTQEHFNVSLGCPTLDTTPEAASRKPTYKTVWVYIPPFGKTAQAKLAKARGSYQYWQYSIPADLSSKIVPPDKNQLIQIATKAVAKDVKGVDPSRLIFLELYARYYPKESKEKYTARFRVRDSERLGTVRDRTVHKWDIVMVQIDQDGIAHGLFWYSPTDELSEQEKQGFSL